MDCASNANTEFFISICIFLFSAYVLSLNIRQRLLFDELSQTIVCIVGDQGISCLNHSLCHKAPHCLSSEAEELELYAHYTYMRCLILMSMCYALCRHHIFNI